MTTAKSRLALLRSRTVYLAYTNNAESMIHFWKTQQKEHTLVFHRGRHIHLSFPQQMLSLLLIFLFVKNISQRSETIPRFQEGSLSKKKIS